ncbi:MAG: hypothetical protein M3Z85_22885 [Acidobacteriota bacterium]|nr:hypothetical protein [Acidobacteriota bacterium]
MRRERAPASSANVQGCGLSLRGYSAKYGLDLRLLKMFPPFEVAGLPWFYKISGRSGSMRSGTVFRLAPLALLTRETASGSWPTLRACSGKRSSGANRTELYRAMVREKLPTLRSTDADRGGRGDLIQRLRGNHPKHHPARMPTMTASDATGGPGTQGRKGGLNLRTAIRLPTMTANRWSGLQSHGVNAMLGPLNPEWCEWFMGFPIGWTGLPPSGER